MVGEKFVEGGGAGSMKYVKITTVNGANDYDVTEQNPLKAGTGAVYKSVGAIPSDTNFALNDYAFLYRIGDRYIIHSIYAVLK